MSKAKKIISMLLAVLMVLSIVPASVLASAATPTVTFSTPTTELVTFATDTSGTSEIIRVAGGEGMFTHGSTIVAATPSGIPRADNGQYIDLAYAGETPVLPSISFKITGVQPDKQPTVVSSLGTNATISYDGVTSSGSGANQTHEYKWSVSSGGTATQGSVVTYTITYFVDGVEYEAYAYSFVEYILIMNGYVAYKMQDGGDHKPDSRHSHIVQVGGRNVYSGWYSDTTENIGRVFINYASGSAVDGGAISGAGASGVAGDMTGYVVDDGVQTSGTPFGSVIKTLYEHSDNNELDWVNVCYGVDGNRGESTVYIDKRNETLGSLNFRVSLQAADAGNDSGPWSGSEIRGVEILSGRVSFGMSDQWDAVRTKATSLISLGEITANVDTSKITVVAPPSQTNGAKGWRYAKFDGAGPSLQNGTTSYQNTLLLYAYDVNSNDNGPTENQEIGAVGVTFVVYNTVDLYNVFHGIMKGANINDGSESYTTTNYITYRANSGDAQYASSAQKITFNKGAHPQASYYTGGWETFLEKYQQAGKVLSQPNTNQTEINKATTELITAYNGLTGYNPTVTYTIKHVLSGGSTEIVNSSTPGYLDTKQTDTVPAGTKITARAATIEGYEVDGDSVKSETASGATSSVTITFNYKAKNVGVNAITNNDELKAVTVTNETTGASEVRDLRNQIYPAAYGEVFYKSTATNGDGTPGRPGVGTQPHWEFVDWYYQNGVDGVWDESQRVPASFTINKTTPVSIYARWDTAPIHVYATPMLDNGTVINGGNKLDLGSVKPNAKNDPVEFARPSADKTTVEGYLFVGFYETYNNGFEGSVEWPITFVLGDNDKNIVARYADVNGKIVFESNGGSACSDFHFDPPQTINESELPVPTRTGYTFMGWYKDVELTQPVFANGATSIEMPNATGFIAYAKWEANDITINFDTAVGARPSKFDTASISSIYPVTVGQAVPSDMIPANPRRFGYEFAGWVYNNRPFDFSKVPVADESITLVATWRRTTESAFIELSAIEKVLGEDVYLDNNDATEDDDIVQHGDIITVRMTSMTNFYVGSSLFIFMYDSDFYELVGSGKDAFALNPENDYISGINAKYTAVTNSSVLPWPAGLDSNGYNAVQIAIDPTVAVDNFNCEPMNGETWMIEFKLKVKDTAEGDGKIYMDNAWTRTPDNIMGTMFYGWASSDETSVADTENNRVTPDLFYAERTLKIDTEESVQTKVTLDAADGVWADGTTANKTYEGTAGAEILDYVAPTKHGFDLDGWYATEGDVNSAKWIEGYYPPEDTLEATYYANWKAKEYPVIFHWDQGSDEIYKEIDVAYMSDIAADAVAAPTKQGYKFANWTDAEGNLVTLPSQMTVADENGYHLYATWTPATDTKFSIKVIYDNPNFKPELPEDSTNRKLIEVTQVQDKNRAAYQGTTGQTVKLVQSVPADADPNTLYITVDQLALVVGGNYVFDAEKYKDINEIDSDVIAADGSTILEVNYVGKIMTFTFKANGGVFADGSDTLIKTDKFMAPFNGLADSEIPTRDGWDFNGWSPAITNVINYNADRAFTAQWKAKAVHVRFMLSETEQYGELAETTIGAAPAAPTAPQKTGWKFVGWNTDINATTGVLSIPAVTTPDTAEGYAITYYAIFSKTPYTITYILDGAPYGETATATMGDVVNVIGPVEKTGYIFNGWMYDGDDVTSGTITMPADNIEITATYTAKTIKVKFFADEGAFASGAEFIEVDSTFDGNINVPAEEPVKAGYEFIGWAAKAEATEGSKTDLGTLTAEAASFYAVYAPELHTYYIDIYEMGTNGQYPEAPTRTETGTAYVDSDVTITSTDDLAGFSLVTDASQTGTVPAEGELRFTVKYERNKYTVVFKMEGKDDVTVTDYYGVSVGADRVPDTTRVGYTFQNWLNTAGEVVAIPVTIPADNLELTADYKIKTHTVKYYTDATKATLDRETTFNYNDDIAFVELYDPTGARTFLGWAYEGTTDIVVSSTATVKVPDADVVLVGIWENNSFRLNYRGATGIHEYFMVEYGTPVAQWPVPATNPVKEGSYFDGWIDSGLTTMPADAVTISPNFVTETYKLQFNETGDTTYGENNVITVTYGQAFDGVDNPEWAGHVFLDWDKEIPTEIGDLGNDGAVSVFTAQWRNEKYTLTFANTGDTVIADKNVEFGDTIEAVGNPSWAGHVFLDWDKPVPTAIGDLGNDGAKISYTAQWRNEKYTLTFANTGDTVIADKNVEFGQTIAATPDPEWAGYVFAGWDVTPPTSIGDLGKDGATITYTAKWTKDTFIVTFNADNGTEADVVSKEFEAEVAAPANPEKVGHVFSHWINTKDNSTVAFPFNMPAEDLSLKAVWTKETYTLKFAETGDTAIADKVVSYGDTIEAITGLTKVGHVFAGWDVTPPTAIGDLGANGAEITYTAQWTKKTYTLKFVDTGDVTIEDKVVKFGETIEVPAELTKEGLGYYFLGTWKDANGNAATPPATIEDMGADGAEFTYVAQWAKETYTIAFNSNGGSAVESIVKQFGDVVTIPAAPTYAGHNFVQWNDENGDKYDIQLIMPDLGENNATVNLTAQWSKKVYTVTFMDAFGDVFETATIAFDDELSTIIPENLPAKDHYKTLGWSLTEGDTVAITEFGKMPANEALVYYPVLERVEVTLALTEGTTAEIFEESIDETDPDNPIKVGYIRGLDAQLTKAALEENYLGVTGDGTLVITPSWNAFNICGTGTVVEVYDNVTGKTVERYYIVVYGDVNGDSGISATDVSAILREVNGLTGWSVTGTEEYNQAYVLAANLKADDGVNGIDASLLRDVTLSVAYIDQTTGTVINY